MRSGKLSGYLDSASQDEDRKGKQLAAFEVGDILELYVLDTKLVKAPDGSQVKMENRYFLSFSFLYNKALDILLDVFALLPSSSPFLLASLSLHTMSSFAVCASHCAAVQEQCSSVQFWCAVPCIRQNPAHGQTSSSPNTSPGPPSKKQS